MQIILRVKTQFFQREKTTDKDGNETLVVKNTVTLNPSGIPQNAPDWITNDPLFNLLVKDGSLVQVSVEQTEKPATVQAAIATVETATQGNGRNKSK